MLEVAKRAARQAAPEILSHWDNLQIEYKGVVDLVTQADVASEKIINEVIGSAFPTHQFFAEETEIRASLDSPHLWIIDPLDGTTNFAGKLPQFCISIAYAENGVVKAGIVYDVVRDEMFHGVAGGGAFLNDSPISVSRVSGINQSIVCTGFAYERGPMMRATLKSIERLFDNNLRGIRRLGSAALDFCWVACGRLDGYFEYILKPWDFAAGALIAQEAGGKICTRTGAPFDLNALGAIVAGPNLFAHLAGAVRLSE
ncbi:MAG: inositol monophosphatase [Deltaproteobacteria bacterium]|nr:inositol monophosphatase [Deltaproteobacteria bacterium]